jgi:alpha-glucosidase
MWWASDALEAYRCEDQFLVGEKLLVAPVVEKGARSRTVFLPAGQWRCGNTGAVHRGPVTIDVPVSLSFFFI